MSGFKRDGGFDLTPTKAAYWHGPTRVGCSPDEGDDIGQHLQAGGLRFERTSWGWSVLRCSRTVGQDSTAIYEALSGRKSIR